MSATQQSPGAPSLSVLRFWTRLVPVGLSSGWRIVTAGVQSKWGGSQHCQPPLSASAPLGFHCSHNDDRFNGGAASRLKEQRCCEKCSVRRGSETTVLPPACGVSRLAQPLHGCRASASRGLQRAHTLLTGNRHGEPRQDRVGA